MKADSLQSTKRAAVLVATLSSFLGPFMSSSVNVALPSIGQEFAMGAVLLGWINTAFLLSAATFLIPFGRLGDIYGRKRIFVLGLLFLVVSSILLAESSSATMLISCRVFQGFGSSMIFATGMPILVSAVPQEERGKLIGVTTAAVYSGLSTGPFFGGFITQQLGWRYIFWLNVPLGLLLLAVSFFMLKGDWTDAKGARFDLAGSAILGIALLATMFGFSSLPSRSGGIAIAAGVVGLISFIMFEWRQEHPVVDMRLFRHNTVFAFSSLAALINYAATFAIGFLLSLYLQKVRGFSPQAAGLVLISQPVVQAVFSFPAGWLSDRMEPRTIASTGMGLSLVGLVLLGFLVEDTTLAYIIFCQAVLGLGFALFSSPNTNAIMSSVDRRSYGVAGAMVSAMRQVGMMLSMGVVMMIMALLLGRAEIVIDNQAAFLKSMRIAFAVFAVASFAGIFASLARGKIDRANRD